MNFARSSEGRQASDRPRFFDQFGHQTTNASIGNKHFFTKQWPRQAHQNYEQPCQKNFCEEYLRNFLKTLIFKVLYLLKMCTIFVGSVHNFGKSADDII